MWSLSALSSLAYSDEAAPAASEETSATPTEWQANYHSAGNRPGASLGGMMQLGPMGGIWQRSQLLGDPLGIRSGLGQFGVSLNFFETSEYLGNTSGGSRQGFDYDGLMLMNLQVDTQRAFGLRGGLFNVSALDVHGLNLSARNLLTLQTASGIEADDGIRLWELWYQQAFYFRQIDVKIGAQSLDQEFMVSQYAGLFVNTMFGWPMLTSADMLSGGPAYPLASLGARVRVQPSGSPWAFLAGIYDDNPAGVNPASPEDPQQLNSHGVNFRLNDSPLVFLEAQYARPALGELEYADSTGIMPGTYKLGMWYDFGQFADQRYDGDGISLAEGGATPALHRGNYSFYGVIDQLIWRESPESEQGVGVFIRAMGAQGDRNPVSFSMNAGLTWREPIEHRENDVVGLGVGRANIGSALVALDQDIGKAGGGGYPVQGEESFVEVTYQYQVVPWWQLQPDFQYVFNPSGGIPNPSDPSHTVANEFVFGIRTNVSL